MYKVVKMGYIMGEEERTAGKKKRIIRESKTWNI